MRRPIPLLLAVGLFAAALLLAPSIATAYPPPPPSTGSYPLPPASSGGPTPTISSPALTLTTGPDAPPSDPGNSASVGPIIGIGAAIIAVALAALFFGLRFLSRRRTP